MNKILILDTDAFKSMHVGYEYSLDFATAQATVRIEHVEIKEFEDFTKCPVILIGLIEDAYLCEGTPSLKTIFARDECVIDKFKLAVATQPLPFEDVEQNSESDDPDVARALQTHAFDMDVATMRTILNVAITPKNAASNRDKRKGLYIEENAPRWWTVTQLPFTSVNHKSGNTERFKQKDLWKLVESLQYHSGITPNPPNKIPRNETFTSRFYQNTEVSSQESESGDNGPIHDQVQSDISSVDGPSSCQPVNDEPIVEPSINVLRAETDSVASRREFIMNLSLHDLKEHPIKVAGVLVNASDWTEFTVLCNRLSSLDYENPDLPAVQWEAEEYCGANFTELGPSYKILETTANGNCLFNSVSLIFHGNESLGLFYRLFVMVDVVDRLPEISKYILLEYKESWHLFAQMITDEFESNELSPQEVLETIFRNEIMETLKSFYRDCSILHVHLLAHVLNRPIQQHCNLNGIEYDLLRKCVLPPVDRTKKQPIHLLWVPAPANPIASRVSHIVPAVCQVGIYGVPKDHCPLLEIQCCVFQSDANLEEVADMIVCVHCGQHVHCVCAHELLCIDAFHCGCCKFDKYFQLKSSLMYKTEVVLEVLKKQGRISKIVKDVMKRPGLRRYMHMKRPHAFPVLKRKLGARTGPFTDDDVNHEIMMLLREYVPDGVHMFIPSVFLHETLLDTIQSVEDVSRILAEFILYGHYKKD